MDLDPQVSRLTDSASHSEVERAVAAKRRSHRLTNFRRLQDQLLHPPKLNSTERKDPSAGQVEDVGKEWSLAEQPEQRGRAQRAHVLAVTAAKVESNKVRLVADTALNF